MKCKNCGFISKGKETYCPYCDEPLVELSFLEKRVNVFNWLYISLRSLIFIIITNINIICIIVELILNSTQPTLFHFSPIVFFASMTVLLFFDNIIVKNSSKKWAYWKGNAIIIITSLLFALSYKGGKFPNYDINVWQFLIGYFLPIGFGLVILDSVIYFIISRKFDIVIMFTGTLFIVFMSSLIFGLSFLNILKIKELPFARIINDISFGFIMFSSFNCVLLSILRLRNKVYR